MCFNAKRSSDCLQFKEIKSAEQMYPGHDLELTVVVFALKILRHYLYGFKFQIFTGHKSLKHLFDKKELIMRKRRWMELLKDYECEIHYNLRRANVVTDALSQKEKAILVNSGLMGIIIQFPGLIIKDKKRS